MATTPFTLPKPDTSIGCQDLLSMSCGAYSGQLMKQITRSRRKTIIGSFLDRLPWVSRYVVLSDGCLYHYHSSQSSKPSGSYSLHGYDRVVRAGDIPVKKQPWAFKIVNHHRQGQAKYFSAGSEREMKAWMKEIRLQLIAANQDTLSKVEIDPNKQQNHDIEESIYGDKADEIQRVGSVEDDNDEYLDIDENLKETQKNASSVPTPPSPEPVPFNKVKSPDVGDEENCQIRLRPALPIPPRKEESRFGRIPVPQPPNSPDKSTDDKRDSYSLEDVYWKGSDKKEAEKIIYQIGKDGVFMLRDSLTCYSVLVCCVDRKPVKFMIKQDTDLKFYIEEKQHFPSIEELLTYYRQHNLPNKRVPLKEPYTKYDEGDYTYIS